MGFYTDLVTDEQRVEIWNADIALIDHTIFVESRYLGYSRRDLLESC